MEAWQVFDASTAELLAQLDLLGTSSSAASRLAALIHQELVERGHLSHFLGNLGVLQDETGPNPALLLQQVPETLTQQAKEWQTSNDELQTDLAADDIGPQQEHNYQAQLDFSTATAVSTYRSKAADTETCETEHLVATINSGVAGDSFVAQQASSVLDAAVAAYKQEKRRLWKAKKAGAQAGWGFTKPQPSWPKPDKRAAAALVPLRSSSKVVAQGSTSLTQQIASCNAPSATPPATQTVHEVQQVEVPQTTADEASSGLSQPLSGNISSAAHQVALPKLPPEAVMPDKQRQQPAYAPCKSDPATLSWQTTQASCTSATGSGQGDSDSLQQLQHSEAGACQEHASGSTQDAEPPQIAAAEAGQNCTSADSRNESFAAAMQHNNVVHVCQQSGLLSNHMYLDAQLESNQDVLEKPPLCCSDVDDGRCLQQHAGSCAIACGHMEHCQYAGSTSGLSSSESKWFSSAELDASAAECDKQAGCQPAGFGDISTSSWVTRPSSSDYASEGRSESSEAGMASVSEATWQEAAMALVAPHQHPPHTAHRLHEWNMPGNEGLCSWPTTPLHDSFNVVASPHIPQGYGCTQNTRSAGMCQSLARSKTDQAERPITFANGERLVLS